MAASRGSHRILYMSEAPFFGGAERYLLSLLSALDRSRFTPTVAGPPNAPSELVNGVRHLDVPFVRMTPVRGKGDVGSLYGQWVQIRRAQPDIVHLNLSNPLHGQYTMLAARAAGAPVRIATMHLPPRETTPTRRGRALECLTLSGLNRVIAVCHSSRDLIVRHFGLPYRSTRTIHNGLDIDAFDHEVDEFRERDPEWGEGPVIGTVGRLAEQKGHRHLLEAARIVKRAWPSATFVIVGDGPLETPLRNLSSSLGLGTCVVFTGGRPDVPAILSLLDLFVLPSLYESFPFAVLEAMAAGKPVVATDVDGVGEAVEDGKTGFLVPSESPGRMADAIQALLRDPARARRMGRAGRRRVEEHFTSRHMQTATQTLYHECLSEAIRGH